MTTMSTSPDSVLPRHWAFASVAAWGDIRIMLHDANLVLPTLFMLDQLVAEFLSDPRIQSDPQQLRLWAQLREQITPLLAEELQRGLADSAPTLSEQRYSGC